MQTNNAKNTCVCSQPVTRQRNLRTGRVKGPVMPNWKKKGRRRQEEATVVWWHYLVAVPSDL